MFEWIKLYFLNFTESNLLCINKDQMCDYWFPTGKTRDTVSKALQISFFPNRFLWEELPYTLLALSSLEENQTCHYWNNVVSHVCVCECVCARMRACVYCDRQTQLSSVMRAVLSGAGALRGSNATTGPCRRFPACQSFNMAACQSFHMTVSQAHFHFTHLLHHSEPLGYFSARHCQHQRTETCNCCCCYGWPGE